MYFLYLIKLFYNISTRCLKLGKTCPSPPCVFFNIQEIKTHIFLPSTNFFHFNMIKFSLINDKHFESKIFWSHFFAFQIVQRLARNNVFTFAVYGFLKINHTTPQKSYFCNHVPGKPTLFFWSSTHFFWSCYEGSKIKKWCFLENILRFLFENLETNYFSQQYFRNLS